MLITLLKEVFAKVCHMANRRPPPPGGHLFGFAVAGGVTASDVANVETAKVATVIDDNPDIALARIIAAARDCEGEGELLSGMTPAQIMQRMLDL